MVCIKKHNSSIADDFLLLGKSASKSYLYWFIFNIHFINFTSHSSFALHSPIIKSQRNGTQYYYIQSFNEELLY